MSHDPILSISGMLKQSVVMRAQFNGLKDLLDSVSCVTSAVVDGVNTVPTGEPATVSVSVRGTIAASHLWPAERLRWHCQ